MKKINKRQRFVDLIAYLAKNFLFKGEADVTLEEIRVRGRKVFIVRITKTFIR